MIMGRDTNEPNKSNIPGLVILTHGKSGEELIRSAEMIIGKMENVVAVSLMPGQDPPDYEEKVSKVLARMSGGALVMVDLFGGTPSNVAAVLSQKYPIAAVSGVNLPMLIEAATLRKSLSGQELAEAVLASAKNSIRDIVAALKH